MKTYMSIWGNHKRGWGVLLLLFAFFMKIETTQHEEFAPAGSVVCDRWIPRRTPLCMFCIYSSEREHFPEGRCWILIITTPRVNPVLWKA